jgi:hypothetical protein
VKCAALIRCFSTRAGIFLLAGALAVLSTQAKLGWYYSEGSPQRHLAKATKMHECRMEKADHFEIRVAAPFRLDMEAPEVFLPARRIPLPKAASVPRPFDSRPPPLL